MPDTLSERLQEYLSARYPDASISDVQFITSGWESDIYAFSLRCPTHAPKSLILRPYLGDGAIHKLNRETHGLRYLHQAGYPVPAVFLSETDRSILGNPFIIMEKLEGRNLWRILAEAVPSQASDLLDRFARLLAELHQLDWRSFTEQASLYEANPTTLLDELLVSLRQLYTQFGVVGFLPIVEWLEQHTSDISVQPAIVHLDFHANNVFVCDDDRLAVIDWTQASVGDYRLDLSWTLMIMGDYGQAGWGERIVHAYTLAARHSVTNLDYFNVISYTKLLASTVIALRDGAENLGMRPETVASVQQQAPVLKTLSQRIREITGLSIAEVETLLSQIS